MNTNLNHESPQKTNFKSGILLVLFFLTTLFSQAQNCPATDYVLNSQADVDAFPAGCDHILGSLTISGADITDLSPLSNIATIEDDLIIIGNPMLTSLDDISGISDIRFFYIENNPMLTAIGGFNSLTTLGRLQIENNAGLVSVNGFISLTAVTDRFRIRNNASLTSFDGLSNLNAAGRTVITNNAGLTNLDGLLSLSQITFGFFNIGSNTNLTNLDGLAALTSVNGSFTVQGNASLTDCCGIYALINTPGAVLGTITISGNNTGCDSEPEVITYCEDADMDGVNITDGDCDDDDDTIYPGAPELCNGIDDNCNGDVDEGLSGFTHFGNVTFNSQAEVDAWPPCYSTINGRLDINGADITDLSPLSNLTTVNGDFWLHDCPLLTNFNGLSSLSTVTLNFWIYNFPALTDLSGLSSVNTVGSLLVDNCDLLTDLSGLEGITYLKFNLAIRNNDQLQSLNGLSNLATIDLGGFFITNNAVLPNLDGLSSLNSIGDRFLVNHNPMLTNIDALMMLTSVGGQLQIAFNHALENLDGLSSLNSIGSFMEIKINYALQNLDGLAALTSVAGDFTISDNLDLTDCCGIYDLLNTPGAITGNVVIFSNNTGCDSEPEVVTYCEDADMDGFNIVDGDCDDEDENTFPGAAEICDGADNDCNGLVDDGPISVYNGNIAFYNQAQVDAWSPCVTTINGSVTIQGAGIIDLSPLMNVQTITGNLTVKYEGVFNLNGLQGLQTVDGTVTIFYNYILSSLFGLENLSSVGGNFWMYYNLLLSDCCAIADLLTAGSIGGNISILYNAAGSHCNSAASIIAACQQQQLVAPTGGGFLQGVVYEGKKATDLTLFPNPARNEVTVRFQRTAPSATLRIMDTLGRIVFERTLEEGVDQLNVDLGHGQFENGLYLVSLFENGEMQTKQLVVQR